VFGNYSLATFKNCMSAGNVFTTNVEHMQYWHIFIEKLVVLSFADVD